jgi:hypothetical protein
MANASNRVVSLISGTASARASRRRARIWLVARVLLGSAALALLAMTSLMSAVCVWWHIDPADNQRSRGVNALWAAHTWVGDPHTDAQYQDFAALLERNEISDVFAHAGPLDGDGTVPDGLTSHAAEFITAMHRYAPGVRVQAYLGQIDRRDGGPLDLRDPSIRARIASSATRFIALGFDGIHYDIEPVYSGDQDFLDLLARTRQVTKVRGAVLSVAMEPPELVPGAQRVLGLIFPGHHDPTMNYLRQVALNVDQVAIMTYDTGLPTASLFGADVAWQTERIVKAIGRDVTVFMGVPTYDDGSFWKFHAAAENVSSGVRAVRKGLDRLARSSTQKVGIAIYAEWTTTADEWSAYESAWLAR